jgi:hypothetical protein
MGSVLLRRESELPLTGIFHFRTLQLVEFLRLSTLRIATRATRLGELSPKE